MASRQPIASDTRDGNHSASAESRTARPFSIVPNGPDLRQAKAGTRCDGLPLAFEKNLNWRKTVSKTPCRR